MNVYKVYIKDNKEVFEIWNGSKLLKKFVLNFGDTLTDCIAYNFEIKRIIPYVKIYYDKCNKFFLNEDVNLEGISSFSKYPVFYFIYDLLLQYKSQKITISPKEISWFDYNFKNNELIQLFDFVNSFIDCCIKKEDFSNLNISVFKHSLTIKMEKIEDEIIEVLYPQCIDDVFLFMIMQTMEYLKYTSLSIKKCKRCEQPFYSLEMGNRVLYCHRKYDNSGNKTCRELHYKNLYFKDESDYVKNIKRLYGKYYESQRRLKNSKKISKKDFSSWSKVARIIRDKCIDSKITINDMEDWLEKNKDNYDWD